MRKILLKSLAILVIIILLTAPSASLAASKTQLNNQMNDIDKEIEQKEAKLKKMDK